MCVVCFVLFFFLFAFLMFSIFLNLYLQNVYFFHANIVVLYLNMGQSSPYDSLTSVSNIRFGDRDAAMNLRRALCLSAPPMLVSYRLKTYRLINTEVASSKYSYKS